MTSGSGVGRIRAGRREREKHNPSARRLTLAYQKMIEKLNEDLANKI